MRLLASLSAALLVVVMAAGAAAQSPPAVFDRVCATRAEVQGDVAGPNARRGDLVVGRVGIIAARDAARPLPPDKPPHNPRAWLLKRAVIIRAGAPVVVRVAARDRPYVAFDHDMTTWNGGDRDAEDGQASVRFHACPPATKRFTDGKPLGRRTVYPGGFIIERPRCVTLEFLEAGRPTVRRRLGLGTRCPG